MTDPTQVARRPQFCARCGQMMFEFYRSSDGHFGLVADVGAEPSACGLVMRCPTCAAPYRLLDRADATGQVVARI